ncbi:YwqG family protein (plasmid) [Streptomyces sp. HUAS 31]|uniref:YwqG family protein n=1 Tax=Streptomyces TaxID=1883 RepID=UPI0023067EF9|nr:YwqG family protein [Streptomyces sp. HUAS 31]WCE02480.1 YwqG family protein [Streptomyces sp. HUAS 31]
MSGFGTWLARFIDDEGELGDFARYAAADPHMPPRTISDRITYFIWLTRHPDTVSVDGRVRHPHLPTFMSAWKRYLHEMVDDTPPPGPAGSGAPVEQGFDALLAAMEGGTQESVAALLSGTELDAQERRALINRATDVRLALADRLPDFNDRGGARYMRVTTAGFVCHTDSGEAADWLVRPAFAGCREPAGPEGMAAHLTDAAVACWEPERITDFIRAAAAGPHAQALYPLLMCLCRRTGITVEPTSHLAGGCVDFYVGYGHEELPPHGLAVTADPREDPLLPRVLPQLQLADYHVGRRLGDDDPSARGRRFLRLVLESGLLDRGLFLRKVIQTLQQVTDEENWAPAGHLATVLEDLGPSQEEFAPCRESYAKLTGVVASSQMSADWTAHAVRTLLREGRLPADLVDRWVQAILDEDTDFTGSSRNCAVAIGEISGSDLLSDDHIAALVQFVTGTRTERPLHVMRALTRHAEHGRLTHEQLVACAHEVLLWPEEDVPTALITLLGQALDGEPTGADTVLPVLAGAFWNPSRAVQEQALTLAGEQRAHAGKSTLAVLATEALQLDPDLRARAQDVFGAAPPPEAAEPSTAGEPGGPVASAFDMSVFDPLLRLLPGEAKDRWLSLLRPSIGLDLGDGDGPVVGHLGGLPELPKDTPWPVWRERPLGLMASVDCALLPREELDIPLPEDGTLLFFRYESEEDPGDFINFYVGCDDFEPGAGTAVLYVPASVPTRRRPAPVGREVIKREPLRLNRVMLTMPDDGDIHLRDAHVDVHLHGQAGAKAFDDVRDLVHGLYGGRFMQIGGYAEWAQCGEEDVMARRLLGPEATEEAVRREERDLVLLACFEDDAAANALYWLIRREDLAARRFDKVVAVAQS